MHTQPDGGFALYWIGSEGRMVAWDSQDPDFIHLNETLWAMAESDPAKTDKDNRSLGQYLDDEGVSPSDPVTQ